MRDLILDAIVAAALILGAPIAISAAMTLEPIQVEYVK